jgi:hypothetical protein
VARHSVPLLATALGLALAGPGVHAADLEVVTTRAGDTLIGLERQYLSAPFGWKGSKHSTASAIPCVSPSARPAHSGKLAAGPAPHGPVVAVSGDVTMDGKPLAPDTRVSAGAILRTGDGGFVTLALPDESRLTVQPGSQARLEKVQSFHGLPGQNARSTLNKDGSNPPWRPARPCRPLSDPHAVGHAQRSRYSLPGRDRPGCRRPRPRSRRRGRRRAMPRQRMPQAFRRALGWLHGRAPRFPHRDPAASACPGRGACAVPADHHGHSFPDRQGGGLPGSDCPRRGLQRRGGNGCLRDTPGALHRSARRRLPTARACHDAEGLEGRTPPAISHCAPVRNPRAISAPPGVVAWSARPDASGYRLQIADDSRFAQPAIDQVDGLQSMPPLGPGRYAWRIASLRTDGNPGPWSDPQTLDIRPAPAPPPSSTTTALASGLEPAARSDLRRPTGP